MERIDWRKLLRSNITTFDELKNHLVFKSAKNQENIERVITKSPLNVNRYYLSLIDKNDPDDPLRKIIVPSGAELSDIGQDDQSGERKNTIEIGIQHKYRQTLVILATNYCSQYCRFCFRKRMIGVRNSEILKNVDKAVSYIKRHPEINNILITGGDPLAMANKILFKIIGKLVKIESLDFIRIGSRVPIVFPMRIYGDPEFCEMLKSFSDKKRIYISCHFEHFREVTPEAIKAARSLYDSNVTLLNQTVLLKGVNDNPKILAKLMNRLVGIGVSPYYIFQCRPVRGATHFQVPILRGVEIIEKAKKLMSGYSKRFRYAMSHYSGKIEIIGREDNQVFLKFHQARDHKNSGKFFSKIIHKNTTWLERDLKMR